MSLRIKSLLIILSNLIIAYGVLFGVGQLVLVDSYEKLEEEIVQLNVSRASNVIDKHLEQLRLTCTDYAAWNPTYEFAESPTEEYQKDHLVPPTYTSTSVHLIMIYNLQGHPLYSGAYDLELHQSLSVPQQFEDLSKFDPAILNRAQHRQTTTGIVNLPQGPLMFAACPILDSNENGPPRGVFLMGRYLNANVLHSVEQDLAMSIELLPFSHDLPPALLNSDRGEASKAAVVTDSEHRVSGYILLHDWQGKPAAALRVIQPRQVYQQGKQTLQSLAAWAMAAELLVALLILIALEKSVISRITGLSQNIQKVGRNEILTVPIDRPGQEDEINSLTREINTMLNTIQQSQLQVQKGWEQYKQLFNQSFIANFIADKDGTLLLYNTAFSDLFNLDTPQDALQLNLFKLYPGPACLEQFMECLQNHTPFANRLLDLQRTDGSPVKVLSSAHGIYNEAGRLQRIQGYLLDITEREQAQAAIRYLSQYDRLTGLINRSFIDTELDHLHQQAYFPFSIIMIDVNGLKIINDTFGHEQGDRCLKKLASILTNCCRTNDMAARWGGDEFLILLPDADETVALAACSQIKAACSAEEEELSGVSVSMGIGCADNGLINVQEVISLAEERMYRNKLLQSNSNLNALIASLQKTLWEKSNETEEHCQRLSHLVSRVGEAMKLSQSHLDELKLLAALHDIGKVAIPHEILDKPGPLTSEEWELIKTHTEVGYRIAQFSPQMASIAQAILAHHERWDGKGYPLGLQGPDIPLIARILSIADAYDVMTHERPYKQPISHSEALQELLRCSGTQFDPELVHIFISCITSGA